MLCRSHGIKPDCGMQDDSQSCVVYSNARRTECYAEAMVLNLIVECRMTASLVLFTQMQEEQSAMQKPWY